MPAESNLVAFPKRWEEDWREIEDRPRELFETSMRGAATFESILESLEDIGSWGTALQGISEQLSSTVHILSSPLRFERIESRLAQIEEKLQRLEGGLLAPVTVRIQSLAPEPFELLRDIEVLIQPSGEGFVASFLDANLSMSGDTQHEALTNLKMLIIDVFEQLSELGEGKLGPGPKRQLRILRSLINEKIEWES